MLRWPEFVRWVQWEHDFKLSEASDATAKAMKIDNLIGQNGKNLSEVLKIVGNKCPQWTLDEELLSFLAATKQTGAELENALKYEVW